MAEPCAVRGEFTIFTARETLAPLLAAVAEGDGPLELDLADVTECDSAGIQLLLIVQREAKARGRPLRLLNPAPCVGDLIDLYGLGGPDQDGQDGLLAAALGRASGEHS